MNSTRHIIRPLSAAMLLAFCCGCQNGQQQAGPPGHAPGKGCIDADAAAHHILAGGSNVKQAHLVTEQDGEGAHQKGRCLDQSVAQVLDLEICSGIVEEVFDDRRDSLKGTGGIDKEQDNEADEQTQENADQGRKESLDAFAFQQILFHAFTSSLLAPAM